MVEGQAVGPVCAPLANRYCLLRWGLGAGAHPKSPEAESQGSCDGRREASRQPGASCSRLCSPGPSCGCLHQAVAGGHTGQKQPLIAVRGLAGHCQGLLLPLLSALGHDHPLPLTTGGPGPHT